MSTFIIDFDFINLYYISFKGFFKFYMFKFPLKPRSAMRLAREVWKGTFIDQRS